MLTRAFIAAGAVLLTAYVQESFAAYGFRCDSQKRQGECAAHAEDRDGRLILRTNTQQCAQVTLRIKGVFQSITVTDGEEEIPTRSATALDVEIESCTRLLDHNLESANDTREQLNSLIADADVNAQHSRDQMANQLRADQVALQNATGDASKTLTSMPDNSHAVGALVASNGTLPNISLAPQRSAEVTAPVKGVSSACTSAKQEIEKVVKACQARIAVAEGICLTGKAMMECGQKIKTTAGSCDEVRPYTDYWLQQGREYMKVCAN